ncbi:MAG: uroporphyrinogen decarboxylase family protein [Draconibacterium sp.]|nr:uroporphyrinogen decarboxylase family protein [Draconibacterium sp.]
MNSRERILAAVAHKEPDKVPVDLGATPSSGISAIAYSNLLKHIGKEYLPVQIYDVVQQLAQPQDEILDLFGVDAVDIGRAFNQNPDEWQPTTLVNGNKAYYPNWFNPVKNEIGEWIASKPEGNPIAKMPVSGTFFDQLIYPWVDGYPSDMNGIDDAMATSMWSAFVGSPWDKADEPEFWKNLRKKTIELKNSTDRALIIGVGCNLFEWGTFIRRMDNFMMDLYLEPENVEKLLDALMEKHLESLGKVCEAVGDVVDFLKFGDDLGGMNGPFMDTETYRKFFKPRHKQLCDFAKQNSSAHTYLHSCGSIYQLIPDLIEVGFEVLNPVQTQGWDMEPERLKREFGNEVTFWGGGVETVGTLNIGTPEKVRSEVLERLEIMSKDGGFVFNTVHNILPDVPPENIVAMFNAIKEFNK